MKLQNDKYFDSGFENADTYQDTQGLIRSLEIQHTDPTLLAIRKQIYNKIKVNAGEEILEIGCGLGRTVREIAALTNNSCKVTGIDKSAVLLNESIRRSDMTKDNIHFQQGDAASLDFANDTFAFACAERVLMHIPEPKKVLSEMTRVLKKGGTLAIIEPDLASVEIYPDYNNVSSQLAKQWCSYTESPMIGKQLLGYFHELELTNIEVSITPVIINNFEEFEQIRSLTKLVTALQGNHIISQNDADVYLKGLSEASKKGQFLYYVNVYAVTGQKS